MVHTENSIPAPQLRILTWKGIDELVKRFRLMNHQVKVIGEPVTDEHEQPQSFDLVIYHDPEQLEANISALLDPAALKLFFEQGLPDEPGDLHPLLDPSVLLVFRSHFAQLMWQYPGIKSQVLLPLVEDPQMGFQGDNEKGALLISSECSGWKGGYDLAEQVLQQVPVDVVYTADDVSGLATLTDDEFLELICRYRFLVYTGRFTEIPDRLIQAMIIGVPVITLSSNEAAVLIQNGRSGFCHTSIAYLIQKMQLLLDNPHLAMRIGQEGRKRALKFYEPEAFARSFENLYLELSAKTKPDTHLLLPE